LRRNKGRRRRDKIEPSRSYGYLDSQAVSLAALAAVTLMLFVFPYAADVDPLSGNPAGDDAGVLFLPIETTKPAAQDSHDDPDSHDGDGDPAYDILPLPSEHTVALLEQNGLIDLRTYGADESGSNGLLFEMRYATVDNFTGAPLYDTHACFLLRETADKLLAANEELMSMGYRIKVFDAYRPRPVQVILYNAVAPALRGYIANPAEGSMHNRGAAVDVTLADMEGNELEMPTGFDHFGPEAHNDYRGGSEASRRNRGLLREVMERHGFTNANVEWWHFDDPAMRRAEIVDTLI